MLSDHSLSRNIVLAIAVSYNNMAEQQSGENLSRGSDDGCCSEEHVFDAEDSRLEQKPLSAPTALGRPKDRNDDESTPEQTLSESGKPLLRRVVSAPAVVVEKTVKTSVSLTKKVAIKTTKPVRKLVTPNNKTRGASKEEDEEDSNKHLENVEQTEEPMVQPEDASCFGQSITWAVEVRLCVCTLNRT